MNVQIEQSTDNNFPQQINHTRLSIACNCRASFIDTSNWNASYSRKNNDGTSVKANLTEIIF